MIPDIDEKLLKQVLLMDGRVDPSGTLRVQGSSVTYEYTRSDGDPSSLGTLSDEVTFPKQALVDLFEAARSPASGEASLSTQGVHTSSQNSESIYTGSVLKSDYSCTTTVRLKLTSADRPRLDLSYRDVAS